jgi:molybdate transport system ATP-binding protein
MRPGVKLASDTRMKAEFPAHGPRPVHLATRLDARVLRHDPHYGLSTLFFGDGELRVPMVAAAVDSGVRVVIDARDVSIALSRPMDVSITNRFPGTIVEMEPLDLPYVRVTFDLGSLRLHALVTTESVERLALEPGLRAWAMIKTVAIADVAVQPSVLPTPRRWPAAGNPD